MLQRTRRSLSHGKPTHRRSRSSTDSARIELPTPNLSVGKSLPESLRRRQTIREFGSKKLSLQLLSNLLWAACGVNRPKGPFGALGITAASASNSQEIDLFVAIDDGVYLFDARQHRLLPVIASNLRTLAIGPGQKNVVMKAPAQLIYVVDIDRLVHTSLGKKLKLRSDQRVLFAQSVGYPAPSRRAAHEPLKTPLSPGGTSGIALASAKASSTRQRGPLRSPRAESRRDAIEPERPQIRGRERA